MDDEKYDNDNISHDLQKIFSCTARQTFIIVMSPSVLEVLRPRLEAWRRHRPILMHVLRQIRHLRPLPSIRDDVGARRVTDRTLHLGDLPRHLRLRP